VEVEHWVSISANSTDDISATRTAFAAKLLNSTSTHAKQQIIQIPVSQTSTKKCTFVAMGFDNLKTAVVPMNEEDDKAILVLLLDELNDLYPLNLCTDIICDRLREGDVFDENKMDCPDLILIGASHLANISRHVDHDLWNVIDLTQPGWRVTSDNVAALAAEVTDTAASVNMESAIVILQLLAVRRVKKDL
jgi:hypothetical protein